MYNEIYVSFSRLNPCIVAQNKRNASKPMHGGVGVP